MSKGTKKERIEEVTSKNESESLNEKKVTATKEKKSKMNAKKDKIDDVVVEEQVSKKNEKKEIESVEAKKDEKKKTENVETKKGEKKKTESVETKKGEKKKTESVETKKGEKKKTESVETKKNEKKKIENVEAKKNGKKEIENVEPKKKNVPKAVKQEFKDETGDDVNNVEEIHEEERQESKEIEEIIKEDNKDNSDDESKYNTVSLKEIREALGSKVSDTQKKSVVKEVLMNIFIAIIMILYLIIVMMGSSNIDVDIFEKDVKIMTLSILAIGIFILEMSYKKDSTKIAMYGTEVLVFAASNLCLVYVIKLYLNSLISTVTYIGIGIAVYYVLKAIILSVRNVRKYRKDNNDIKEIVKKKVKEI